VEARLVSSDDSQFAPGAAAAVPGTNRLLASYSQKALFVSNIERSAAWYTEEEDSTEAAIAWTKVGLGHLGYVGDVNVEKGSLELLMPMCGLADCWGKHVVAR
jgi:hypothetical protein